MRATLKSKIVRAENTADGEITLTLESKGKVETNNISAQMIALNGTVRMKAIVAAPIKLGATITIIISDEEPNEGTT